MTTIPLPGLAFIVRRERRNGSDNYVPNPTVRLPVKASPELAPKPIDRTSFYGVGRDPQHTWPTRDVYNPLNIADINSHMAPNFKFPKVPSAMVVGMATGAQMPVAGRPNIDPPAQTDYGSLATFKPNLAFDIRYAKLIGG